MGASPEDFTTYPRTPHLFGSRGTDDDKHLGQRESLDFIDDASLIVEEKLDGTNVGIHFTSAGRMVLQCRGHEIGTGLHAQYDLFKQWTMGKRPVLEAMLGNRLLLFGEWLYARHSVHYRRLPHYFFKFDIYDKRERIFLNLASRLEKLGETGILTVPVVSLDDLRTGLGVDATENQGGVIQAARAKCREHLRAGRDFAFNATNTVRQTRERWVDLFADYGARVDLVYLEPPLPTILQQNERRAKPVPRQVIQHLVDKLEPPTSAEAHSLSLVG